MEYIFLTDKDKVAIRQNRLRELEVAHFQMCLEEGEEPEKSPVRTRAITDLARRISAYQAELELVSGIAGDSLERDTGELAQP